MAASQEITVVLVDTSVWIDFFKGRDTPEVMELEDLLSRKEKICTCGVVLTEVLQGFRDERDYERALFRFRPFIFLTMERDTFINAANLHRRLRRRGVTIRKPMDCLIAAVAIEHRAALLHHDRDFDALAKYEGLKVVETRKK